MKLKIMFSLLFCLLFLLFAVSCDSSADEQDSEEHGDKTQNPYEELKYELSEDGTNYVVTGIGTCKGGNITIPSTYNGKPVSKIGKGAFLDCQSLKGVVIPEGVKRIEMGAFAKCENLADVYIPSSVDFIGMSAFSGCVSLTSVKIPSGVSTVENFAFSNNGLTVYCEAKEQPSGWSEQWFRYPVVWDCNNNDIANDGYAYTVVEGTRYRLRDGVVEVAMQPDKITKLHISANITYKGRQYAVTKFAQNAIAMCADLSRITVDESSVAFKAMDGILYTKDGKTLIRTAIGANKTRIEIPSGVESIADMAFVHCSKITEVVLPEGLLSIGQRAFYSCIGLTDIKIPSGVKTIGESAFDCCINLTSITIPSSAKIIGDNIIAGCRCTVVYCEAQERQTNWSNIWNGANNPVVWNCNENDVADDGYIYVLFNGLRYAICGNEALVAIQLRGITKADISKKIEYNGNSYAVTSIGDGAFDSCEDLASVTIPEGIKSIGENALSGCGISSIVIPEGVETLGNHALAYNSLVEVVLPKSLISMGDGMFSNCLPLTEIVIPENVAYIGEYAFTGCRALTVYYEGKTLPTTWNKNWNAGKCPVVLDCRNNEKATNGGIYVIIDGIRYVLGGNKEAAVSQQNFYVENATIPSVVKYKGVEYAVTRIEAEAFMDCNYITEAVIPEGVVRVGEGAFASCYLLTSITIPNSVTSIGALAFEDNDNLTIYCEAESQPNGWEDGWNISYCHVVWNYKQGE